MASKESYDRRKTDEGDDPSVGAAEGVETLEVEDMWVYYCETLENKYNKCGIAPVDFIAYIYIFLKTNQF